MAELVVQRVVFPLENSPSALYYRILSTHSSNCHTSSSQQDRRSFVLGPRERIDTNTYFNSFFETYWRQHTTLDSLVLRLRVSGSGTIRLLRMIAADEIREIASVDFEGENQLVTLAVPSPYTRSQSPATLFFELTSDSQAVTVSSGEWVAMDVEPAPVRLVAGYCTFHREAFILKNLTALASDSDLAKYLSAIVVVDQGEKKVKNHPDYRKLSAAVMSITSFVDQSNYGGAGGFTRCIIEAMAPNSATHVLLLDDDAVVEPESVFRTAAFFALAKESFAIGGPMLDLLKPTNMYEAGGFVHPRKMAVGRRGEDLSLDSPQNVFSLADEQQTHYNAWWFFACPVSVIKRCGLPLPLFIRCDDLEFGCRLMRAGIPTITVPGLAVWHLPFYVKTRSWTDYYSHRNMLVAIALHFDVSRVFLAITFLRILLHRLLSLDYFKAWALCEGIADYLSGPLLLQSPKSIHAKVLTNYRDLSEETVTDITSLRLAGMPAVPSSTAKQLCSALGGMLWQLIHRSPAKTSTPSLILEESDAHWHAMRKVDVVAIQDRHCSNYTILRRNRGKCIKFFTYGVWLTLRLLIQNGRVARRWRTGVKCMKHRSFWQKYLGITANESQGADWEHSQDSVTSECATRGDFEEDHQVVKAA